MSNKHNINNYQDSRPHVRYTNPDLPVEEIEFNTVSREDIEALLRKKGYSETKAESRTASQDKTYEDEDGYWIEETYEDDDGYMIEETYEDDDGYWAEETDEAADGSEKKDKEPKKKKPVIVIIILIVALGLLAFAFYRLVDISMEYNTGTAEYEEVADKAVNKTKKIRITKKTEDKDEQELPVIDFAELEAINKDVIAWIYFEDPATINYPVTRGRDNAYYLNRTYTGKVNSSGSIFMDMHNADEFTDANTILYGHNMKNGSMFAWLVEYLDEEFALSHPVFYIYTKGGGVYQYRIYAVYETDDNSQVYTVGFANKNGYKEYIDYCREQSMFDFGTKVDPNKPSVTLSTCTNTSDEGRYVVQAVLDEVITEGEPAISKLGW